jgi:hypothetical protein
MLNSRPEGEFSILWLNFRVVLNTARIELGSLNTFAITINTWTGYL